MNDSQLPTVEEIEALTAFLPLLYADGFSPVIRWEGGRQEDGSFTMPYPDYHPLVDEFFRTVSGRGWLDTAYDPEQANQMLQDENLVKTASLAQIRTMLTFCVRGERFSDGHWAETIAQGHIRRLLERLNGIKVEQFR